MVKTYIEITVKNSVYTYGKGGVIRAKNGKFQ